jgi:glycosyltransferase involved in cell wall biosynthesis
MGPSGQFAKSRRVPRGSGTRFFICPKEYTAGTTCKSFEKSCSNPGRMLTRALTNIVAAIPAPLKKGLKSVVAPLLSYLRSGKSSPATQRIQSDWEFLSNILAGHPPVEDEAMKRRPSRSPSGPVERPGGEVSRQGSNSPHDAKPLNIVMINYGPYDNNSGIHIGGFANALTELGHRVVVSAAGAVKDAGELGLPRFCCVPHQLMRRNPEALERYFAQNGTGTPDLVHCWTPRGTVRSLARTIIKRYGCPYIVHLEDNEMAVARAGAMFDFPRDITEFVADSAGATIIVESLRELLPEDLSFHVLEPGVHGDVFGSQIDDVERQVLCRALGIPSDAWITVYPGNIHAANVADVLSLYIAIQALNRLGYKIHLVRTGLDLVPLPADSRRSESLTKYVTHLGFVRRDWLIDILKLADFFVQPGGPGDFNDYRLPSKIPELLATGRPLVLAKANIGLRMSHRFNALLMERGDAAEITECVKTLLIDFALADSIGREGRNFAIQQFNWERSAKKLERFYRDLLRQIQG